MSSQATPPVITQAPPPPPPPRPYRRRRSWAGPIVLIVIGVVFLLKNLGYGFPLFETWAKWWPLLLIIWGLVKVVEYAQARHEGEAAPGIGGGGVVLLVFVILFGLIASGVMRVREHWNQNGPPGFVFDGDNDLAQLFGNRYQFTQQIDQALPASALLRVRLDRGDVRVVAGTDDKLHVSLRKTIYASNQGEADRFNNDVQPQVTTSGNVVDLTVQAAHPSRTDLEIQMPRSVQLDVVTKRGDVDVSGRDAALTLQTDNGDVTSVDVKGDIAAHVSHGDLRAERITGNISLDGRVNDTTLNDVSGAVSLNGDFFGDIQANRVGGPLTFRSARTDLSVAKVEGTFRMSGDSVDATQVTGPVRLVTRSKDVRLDQAAGDVRVETTNGDVEIGLVKIGSVDVQDRNSTVTLRLPSSARFQLEATAMNGGDINSEFPGMKTEKSGETTRMTGSVGGGGPRVQINNEHADIQIRKGR